jgi:hypothetical protein
MKAVLRVEVRHDRHRLCGHRHDGGEFAAFQHLEGRGLIDVDGVDLDPNALEHRAAGVVGAAALDVKRDPLARELTDVGHVAAGDHMELVVEQAGHVGDLAFDVRKPLVLPELLERVGPHEAEVDALQEPDVVGVLAGSLGCRSVDLRA